MENRICHKDLNDLPKMLMPYGKNFSCCDVVMERLTDTLSYAA
jgi:hypothetical protein